MKKGRRRAVAVLAVSALIGGLGTSVAYAGAAVSWASDGAGYSGKSWYSTQSGIGYSITTVSDNDKVGAAIRYYSGSTPYTKKNGYAERQRAVVPTGGYHQSYRGWTVTLPSNA